MSVSFSGQETPPSAYTASQRRLVAAARRVADAWAELQQGGKTDLLIQHGSPFWELRDALTKLEVLTRPMHRKVKPTHIPDVKTGRTYCGCDITKVRCIDMLKACIESATCRTCQRADDRRALQHDDNLRKERAAMRVKEAGKKW